MSISPRTLRPSSAFTPKSISGLALWLDASSTGDLYTTDAGPVTAVSSPTEISGCVGWWDASDLSSMRQNSDGTTAVTSLDDPVGYWADKSGGGRHARQATSQRRPAVKLADRNGLAGLNFDGSDDFFQCDSGGAFLAKFAIAVMRRTATPPLYASVFCMRNASSAAGFTNSAQAFFFSQTSGGGYLGYMHGLDRDGGVIRRNGLGLPITNSGLFNIRHALVFDNTTDTHVVGIQGDNTSTSGTQYPLIGSDPFDVTRAFPMRLYELIVYDTVPDLASIARVEAYLAAKWGISGVHAQATATSDPVGYWRDRSGNNRHATQATAGNRPAVSATTQGGRKALAFDTQTKTVISPASVAQYVADATTSPKMFFAWVARPEGSATGICWGSPTHPNAASRVFYASDFGVTGGHIVDFGSVSTARLTGTVGDETNNVGHVYSAFRDGAIMSVRRDGVEIIRKTNASGAYTDTTGTLAINTTAGGSATASWMEFLAVANAPSASRIAQIERYLATKWGITLAPQVSNADAQDWINRVYANGGTVSASTAAAVNQFCVDIEAASIRDRFFRLNLFCGTGLNACLVPLYRGPSIGGAQFGNTTDTNVGPFVTGDYSETGASGGLQGNGSSKYLNTGFNVDQLPGAANCHLSSFITGTQDITSVRTLVGTIFNSVTDRYRLFLRTDSSTPPNYTLQVDLGKSEGVTQLNRTNTSGGLLVGSRTSTTNLSLYANGVSAGTNTNLTAETTGASPFFVFARNGPTEFYNGRMAAYSIGAGMTAAQVTAFNTAMQAFQTALTRNV